MSHIHSCGVLEIGDDDHEWSHEAYQEDNISLLHCIVPDDADANGEDDAFQNVEHDNEEGVSVHAHVVKELQRQDANIIEDVYNIQEERIDDKDLHSDNYDSDLD